MKTFFCKSVFLAVVLVVLCYSCATTEQAGTHTAEKPTAIETKQPERKPVDVKPVEEKPVEVKPAEKKPAALEKKPKEQPVIEKPAEQPVIVGEIGEYLITREGLEERLIGELRTYPAEYGKEYGPVDANTVLTKMIAEKAMIMEGRKQNLVEGDTWLERSYKRDLETLLKHTQLEGKIQVTDSEIEEKIKANPKLDRERAKRAIEWEKQKRLMEQFYNELYKKLHVRKLRHNFPKAAQIHQRLLHRPQKERRGFWIMNRQIQEELTAEEKGIVLVTFDGGQVTLLDWFKTLNEIPPLKRPKDLNTIQGVEGLLDRTMGTPIFIAEAKLRGLDKDENFVRRVRAREDRKLLDKVRKKALAGRKKLTKEEIADYFNKHKEEFRRPDTLRVGQVWCEDLKTAEKVKEELNSGRDFESVKEEYSLRKKDKPSDTSVRTDGIFFEQLWNCEPNEIVGPIKGFYRSGRRRQVKWLIKWRIVKILKKSPGKIREYSSGIEREVRSTIRRRQEEAILVKYRKELLRKYAYKLYSERLKNIDPLDIP